LGLILALLLAGPAQAHPAPFSYLDVDIREDGTRGMLTVHMVDAAHELGIGDPEELVSRPLTEAEIDRIERLLSERVDLRADGMRLDPQWGEATAMAESDALRFAFTLPMIEGGSLTLDAELFPYDPQHQTFANIYENGGLAQQWIFSAGDAPRTFYRGTAAGTWDVIQTFVPAGAWHILIGADHLLFLAGLMLLGGGWKKTAIIVTAFTVGHSVTLSLAALSIWSPPGWIVEPAIALTIIIVGVDNLLRGEGRDLRAGAALLFGLIHGFGFAGVLAEFGLPPNALGWSLFSFNLGVEIGQLAFVIPLAAAIGWLWRKRPDLARKLNLSGSIVVIAAGSYWFAQRTFLAGVV
jgi:hypothetical protein